LSVHPEENLEAAVFPFNAAENPRWDIHQARWAALLLPPDEVIFLQGDFPGARWWKPPVPAGGDDELEIGLIPVMAGEGARVENWVAASQWFQKADVESINVSNPLSYQEAVEYWLTPPASLKKDRFLQACYWERLAEFYYYHGFETHYGLQVDALQSAVAQGYPAAHLYYDLGCLLLRKKNYPESRRALEKALRCDPDNMDFKKTLGLLDEMEKPFHP
jgi:tetratricopeptide (TPR) repeat protein